MPNPEVDFAAPARLFQANSSFAQFGDGYRQVTDSQDLATGDVAELIAKGRTATVAWGKSLFINNIGDAHFFTLDEVEEQ